MPMLEDVKKTAEKVMGWSRPKRTALSGLIRPRKASTFRFKDDGSLPTIRNGRCHLSRRFRTQLTMCDSLLTL
jgi:hypothetical protein